MFELHESCELCTVVEQAGRRYCLFCGLSEESQPASQGRVPLLRSQVSALLSPVAVRAAGLRHRQETTQHQR